MLLRTGLFPQVLCALLPSRGLAAFITDIPGELSQCFSVSLVLRGCWACREEGAGPLVVAAGAWWVADNQRRVSASPQPLRPGQGRAVPALASVLAAPCAALAVPVHLPTLPGSRQGRTVPAQRSPPPIHPPPSSSVCVSGWVFCSFSLCKAVRLSEDINLKWTFILAINTLWEIMNLSLNLGLRTVSF